MTEEILINASPRETRVARLEDGILHEILIEREANKGIVGNIYLGKVVRVLPGMQAAFIDIGLQRTAFLHIRDLAGGDCSSPGTPHLHHGETILLQACKNPIGAKGARLTGQISLPSRHLVYLPNSDYLGVSKRITDDATKERLLSMLTGAHAQLGITGGFILRTAAEHATEEEISDDMKFLLQNWQQIRQSQHQQSPPALLHRDLPLALRVVRDLAPHSVKKVRIDSIETHQQVIDFAAALMPDLLGDIEHYTGDRPIFDLYAVEEHIHNALQKRVHLPSGGYLLFDQTEAMTTIDINTGSYIGAHDQEETFLKTNLEAAQTLARQLRVRNIGGLIIIDFIDMSLQAHCEQVMRALESELARDPTRTQVGEMSSLGLVEITRKRTSESLERQLTEPCPACRGRGIQQTAESTCYEIFRELLREARDNRAQKSLAEKYLIIASQAVVDMLRENESAALAGMQKMVDKIIDLQVEPNYRQEQFDVVAV